MSPYSEAIRWRYFLIVWCSFFLIFALNAGINAYQDGRMGGATLQFVCALLHAALAVFNFRSIHDLKKSEYVHKRLMEENPHYKEFIEQNNKGEN